MAPASAGAFRVQSLLTHIVRDFGRNLRAREAAIHHGDRHVPRIEEHGPDMELAAVAHREPQPIVELFISHGEAEALDVGAEEHLYGHRDMNGEFGRDRSEEHTSE